MSTSRSPQATETLTELVAKVAGTRGVGLTYDQLSERSLDPATGYRASRNLLNSIGRGRYVKITPAVVGALATGLGLPLARVRAAAARQYLGQPPGSQLVGIEGDLSSALQDDMAGIVRMGDGVPPAVVAALSATVREVWEEFIQGGGDPVDTEGFFAVLRDSLGRLG